MPDRVKLMPGKQARLHVDGVDCLPLRQRTAAAFCKLLESFNLGFDSFFPFGNRIPWLTHACHRHAWERRSWSRCDSGSFCFFKFHRRSESSRLMGWGSSVFIVTQFARPFQFLQSKI